VADRAADLRADPRRPAAAGRHRHGGHDHDPDGLALDSKLTTSCYDELAAVPSLHAGFVVAVSAAIAAAVRRPWARALAWTWAPVVCLAVVATVNHFVADILAGVVVTVLGFAAGRAASRYAAGVRPTVTPAPAMSTSG
jgi:hypothetical protein